MLQFHTIWSEMVCCVQSMTDFKVCRWPQGLAQHQLAEYMDRMNDEPLGRIAAELESSDLPVITFSHFVPRQVGPLPLCDGESGKQRVGAGISSSCHCGA